MSLEVDAVAAELRAERARGRYTIDDLAAATGMSRSTVLNYLNAKRDIPMTAFLELCDVMEVDPLMILERARG